jgi:O-antigen/teichoic acid export membrane protein
VDADESQLAGGRRETELERADRNLAEILQEVRVVQTGVQVLFGFLLAVAFQQRFHGISDFQRYDYFATLLAAGMTVIMLTAPTSYHRILFRRGEKEHLVKIANVFTMIGLASMAVTMIGAVILVSDSLFPSAVTIAVGVVLTLGCLTAWYALPLARRRAPNGNQPPRAQRAPTRAPRTPVTQRPDAA